MSLKSRIEKLEDRTVGNRTFAWDRERLTAAEVAFMERQDKGFDTSVFTVIEGTDDCDLAQSIVDKHSDVISPKMPRLIVMSFVGPGDIQNTETNEMTKATQL